MKKYEVTYHLTNGEIKKVIYKNINKCFKTRIFNADV